MSPNYSDRCMNSTDSGKRKLTVGRTRLSLAVIAVVITSKERSIEVGLVGDGLAEAVSGERHCELLSWSGLVEGYVYEEGYLRFDYPLRSRDNIGQLISLDGINFHYVTVTRTGCRAEVQGRKGYTGVCTSS